MNQDRFGKISFGEECCAQVGDEEGAQRDSHSTAFINGNQLSLSTLIDCDHHSPSLVQQAACRCKVDAGSRASIQCAAEAGACNSTKLAKC
jgi:hypothetical protein